MSAAFLIHYLTEKPSREVGYWNEGIERALGNPGPAEFPLLPDHLYARTNPPTAGLQVPGGRGLRS